MGFAALNPSYVLMSGLEPNAAATFDSRGLIYLKSDEWVSTIVDYSSAQRLDPKVASSLYGRGFAKLKKGETNEGNADLAAVKELAANIAEQFVRYGVQ